MSLEGRYRYNGTWLRYAWRRWLRKYYAGGPVVDYGCGIGVNGSILQAIGVRRVVGLDLDWGCLLESRGRGLTVLQGNFRHAVPFRSGIADIVLLIHVLEHFEDGEMVLSSVSNTVRPGGAVVVVTPDWRKNYVHFYDDPTHHRPYTRASLEAVLRKVGLQPRVLLPHNVGYHVGWTPLWRVIPRLCFTGDALFAIAERNGAA